MDIGLRGVLTNTTSGYSPTWPPSPVKQRVGGPLFGGFHCSFAFNRQKNKKKKRKKKPPRQRLRRPWEQINIKATFFWDGFFFQTIKSGQINKLWEIVGLWLKNTFSSSVLTKKCNDRFGAHWWVHKLMTTENFYYTSKRVQAFITPPPLGDQFWWTIGRRRELLFWGILVFLWQTWDRKSVV